MLASRGETATEIASHLFVSKRTVESHLVSVYEKLGVGSKTELIRRAVGVRDLAKSRSGFRITTEVSLAGSLPTFIDSP